MIVGGHILEIAGDFLQVGLALDLEAIGSAEANVGLTSSVLGAEVDLDAADGEAGQSLNDE